MKAPDKIYIQDYNTPKYGLSTTWTTEKVENDAVRSIKYIRKDILLEWAKEKLSKAEIKARGYSIGVSAGRYLAYMEVIEKLNEM